MITLFNFWHYFAFSIGFLIFLVGVFYALKQEKKSNIPTTLIFITLMTFVMSGITIVVVDEYTKKAKIYRLQSQRNLNTEQIVYSGIVKNEGSYEIGKVTIEIKLANKGNIGQNLKASAFFSPTGSLNFSGSSSGGGLLKENKPQEYTHEFVAATNLKPGESKEFMVYLPYPPHFTNISEYTEVYAH